MSCNMFDETGKNPEETQWPCDVISCSDCRYDVEDIEDIDPCFHCHNLDIVDCGGCSCRNEFSSVHPTTKTRMFFRKLYDKVYSWFYHTKLGHAFVQWHFRRYYF
jgi:hypothetical protein